MHFRVHLKQRNCTKVSSRVPFQWLNSEEVPFHQRKKMGNLPGTKNVTKFPLALDVSWLFVRRYPTAYSWSPSYMFCPCPSDILSPPLRDYHLTLSTVNQCLSTADQCDERSEITWSLLLKKYFLNFDRNWDPFKKWQILVVCLWWSKSIDHLCVMCVFV